jgi:Uma2 family endonuclease
MSMVINDPGTEELIRRQRKDRGLDAHDEVWDGVYIMPPIANNEHQEIVHRLCFILESVIGVPRVGKVRPGVNVSDREVEWEHNYRVPDVVVFLNETTAKDCGAHWFGGPDFAVEVMSKGDKARDKLPFYAKVNTRELMLIDRNPWSAELYRLDSGALKLVGVSTLASPKQLTSLVVPLHFKLVPAAVRPVIEVVHHDGQQRWIV